MQSFREIVNDIATNSPRVQNLRLLEEAVANVLTGELSWIVPLMLCENSGRFVASKWLDAKIRPVSQPTAWTTQSSRLDAVCSLPVGSAGDDAR